MTADDQTLPAPLPPVLTAASKTHVINVLRRACAWPSFCRVFRQSWHRLTLDTKSGPPMNSGHACRVLLPKRLITRALARLSPERCSSAKSVSANPGFSTKIAKALWPLSLIPSTAHELPPTGYSTFGMSLR